MAERYFKKPNGIVVQVNEYHDIKSLEERFEECDKNGKKLKKETKKKAKK
tara:strand:- start:676 stop:825 length:150 start_codon:yes stop_codon:yes gene_type:complete